MKKRNIYVASSFRNKYQPDVVMFLKDLGHDVYDFHNPLPGVSIFSWKSVDPNWMHWTPSQWKQALRSSLAQEGHQLDKQAMDAADTCVLVLPAGRSAHLEAGFMAGQGKDVWTFVGESVEPDLMNLLFGGPEKILTTYEELIKAFS